MAKNEDALGEQERLLKKAESILLLLAPSIAVLARDERHAPSTRAEMLEGEKQMLEFLTEMKNRK